ncbi:MAG: hypothetical protein LBQ15_03120 [Clostridium sp.]|nr:hypothetical protein [Clostridium sp.]
MEFYFLIKSLPAHIREKYYEALAADDKTIIDTVWEETLRHLTKMKDCFDAEKELALLLKYENAEECDIIKNIIQEKGLYHKLVDSRINRFEEILNVDSGLLKNVLGTFDAGEIYKACLAASPKVVGAIKSVLEDDLFEYYRKQQKSTAIAEITQIQDRIVEAVNKAMA